MLENVTATAYNYTVNVATSAPGAVVDIKNSALTGLNVVNVAAAGAEVTITGGTITCNDQNDAENYAALSMNRDAKGAKITAEAVNFHIKGDSVRGSNGAENGMITIDGTTDGVKTVVAYIAYGNNYYSYTSLEAAITAAKDGETVGMLNDIVVTDADIIMSDNYPVMFSVEGKDITLDMNGKKIDVQYTGGQYLYAVIRVADGAGLTITGNGKINVAENGINVAYMFWKAGTTGHLTINDGYYHMDDAADSVVYTNGDRIVTINGGSFVLDKAGTRANGFPWIFNTQGRNQQRIVVNNGSFCLDVFHQYWIFEVEASEKLALKQENGMYTVVPAVAYVEEQHGKFIKNVGYASVMEAFAAAKNGESVVLLKDVELSAAN